MPLLQHEDTTIHYERSGSGPLLTLCGGLGDSFRNWQALITKLSTYFDIVYIQNRGAGQSFRPLTPYSIDDMAQDMRLVLQHENITKTHLMGFSMGGRVALSFALNSPELLDKLILISTSSGFYRPQPASESIQEHLLHFDGSEDSFSKTFEILYSPDYRKNVTAKAFAKFRKSDPFPQSLHDYQLQLQAIVNFDVSDELSKIKNQTLIFAGNHDALTPFENALFMHHALPLALIKIYENTGHLLQFEKQKEFIHDLVEFIHKP